MTRILLLFLFLFSLTCSTASSQQLDHPLTLGELVGIALQNNPETRQAWRHAQRAASSLGVAKSAYYPKIGISGTANHGRDFRFINGPDTTYTIVGADLTLSMMLFDFGERKAGVEAARQALTAANWQNDWTMQKVMVRALENGYAVMHAQDSLQAAICSLEDAQQMLYSSKELNRVGLTPVTDVYTSQSTYAQMQMDVAEKRALLEIKNGKLATSIGFPADTHLQIASIESLPQPKQQQTAELIKLAGERRADLIAKRARVQESYAKVDKAYSGYGPRISLSGRGGGQHAFHDKADAAHYQIALNLEMPLFSGFETVYQNRLALADAEAAGDELAQFELEVSQEVLSQSKTLEAAQKMVIYAEENLQNASKAYEGVLDKYKAGKERIAEVSNALRQLASARARLSDVKTRYMTAIANLAYVTGTLAPNTETLCESIRYTETY